jgi:hypothetical protein
MELVDRLLNFRFGSISPGSVGKVFAQYYKDAETPHSSIVMNRDGRTVYIFGENHKIGIPGKIPSGKVLIELPITDPNIEIVGDLKFRADDVVGDPYENAHKLNENNNIVKCDVRPHCHVLRDLYLFDSLITFLEQNPEPENVDKIKHYLTDRLYHVLNPPNHVKNWFQTKLRNIPNQDDKNLFINIFDEFIEQSNQLRREPLKTEYFKNVSTGYYNYYYFEALFYKVPALLTDLSFLVNILEYNDNETVVVISGDMHRRSIEKLLIKFGYKRNSRSSYDYESTSQ